MNVSNAPNVSHSRVITPAKNSSDRQSDNETQVSLVENKAQEQAQQQREIQDKLQQRNEMNQRRLDGRLISFGHAQDDVNREQKQTSFNRSRVNEAYSAPKSESTRSSEQSPPANEQTDAIDIVV